MMNSEYYPHLEIQIAEHCNLNCASCTHFSPLAEPSFLSPADFRDQLRKADRIFRGRCKSLKIMGGEPLLHPEIDELLSLAREAMPSTKITVQTNGILLTKMTENFWRACRENGILIRVTRYPVKLDLPAISALAEKFQADLKFHPSDSEVKSFNLYPIDIHGTGREEENYCSCRMKRRYILIKNGKLFPCPIAGNAEHFNRAFGTELDCGGGNCADLDEIHSFGELEAFAEHAILFCRYCRPAEYRRDIGWAHSQKNITEWT